MRHSRCSRGLAAIAQLLLLNACGAEVTAPDGLGPSTSEPGGLGGFGGAGGAGGSSPSGKSPPTVVFTSPADGTNVTADHVTFAGAARSGTGVASVFVAVGPNVPVRADSMDDYASFQLASAVPVGDFTVTATAYDVLGQPSAMPALLHLSRPSSTPDDASPTVVISAPADGSTPPQSLVLVSGTTTDDRGVVGMDVSRNGVPLTDRAIETQDFFAHYSRLVTLLPGEDNVLVFTAHDAAGHTGSAKITLHGPSVADTDAPLVAFVGLADGDTVSTDTLAVAGTASDKDGVSLVKVRVGTTSMGTTTFSAYSPAMTSTGFSQWASSVAIPSGPLVLEARAIDVSGVATSATVHLTNSFVPTFSAEVPYPLALHDGDPLSTLSLSLDRDGVNAIIDADLQKTIQLLSLDPTALLANSLDQIKVACGTAWKNDSPDPMHDCSLTPLGQTFHGPDGTWESSPEYSLIRILTMTPANVVVKGTSIAGVENIADGAILGIKVGGGFNQILAETLGIDRTAEIVDTSSAAAALRDEWMASHPALAPTGFLPITLYDAMNDLTPLGAELGPSGSHPGVLDPSSPPHSVVFGPNFEMVLQATSHLRWKDGVDLSMGKEYIAVKDQPGGDVLTFDFTSPATFDVIGLTPSPTVDLKFKVQEDPTFISSCNGDQGCVQNLPGKPYGSGFVWEKPPWELEPIVTYAAYTKYQSRVFDKCYIDLVGCKTEVMVGQQGNPPGWTHFDILFNLGNPPKDQYLWELIGEVAQVALHNFKNTTLPEGQANVGFTLQNVGVGLTADGIRTAVRPVLQAQGSKLSQGLLGDYAKNNGAVDFFYQSGKNGEPYLFFVSTNDPRPITSYGYARPGFFADAALTTKLSSAADGGSGDTDHEKLALSAGQTIVYAADDTGAVYRIRLVVGTGASPVVTAWVSKKVGN